MRFIFHYPETSGTEGDMLDPGPLRDVAQAAERAGFDALSLTEHPVPGARWLESGGHQSLDPFVGLGYVAAATERLRLLTHLSVAPYRNPFLLAKAAATVDKISDGRFTLGIGAGYQKSEFYALGVNFEERNALFDEILDVLPLHWKGEPFSYQGLHFDARNVIARPRPVQDPIPVWIGGNSKLSRRRVAARAQGWMAMSGGPELSTTARTVSIGSLDNLAGMIREVRDTAAANGRTDLIDVSYSYSGVPSETSITAEADRHREALAEIEKAGVTWVVISSHTRSAAETISFIETFGETLIP
ncbi:LLM class F420-dependent oxidoreductase [Parafrankia sp. EUN1f]|uniref:LLM class F420-dependent oxidoreductase n=1 Tax=Parafrankia sp. EUN1f TaxID=102897 RepID=UPI0001C45B08|nr:LLM class F420-dependent oxidoreductase [Parafrankia sp. EUN1f]EFC81804.1 Luciferase-like monooxygenase [Parafrankia sp. EUN1f]